VSAARLAAACAALALAGCAALHGAPLATAQVPPSRPAAPSAPSVPADSLPSPAALEVLRTIPEPLAPEERFAPPPPGARAAVEGARAPEDSARAAPADSAGAPADSVAGAAVAATDTIPVPAPTRPIGERPGEARPVTAPDSLLVPAAPPAAFAARTPSGPAAADTCWRVQFAAPARRAAAVARRDAVTSLFGIEAAIVSERGLHKVRSAGCLDRTAADRLRDRARLSGFEGAFVFGERRAAR